MPIALTPFACAKVAPVPKVACPFQARQSWPQLHRLIERYTDQEIGKMKTKKPGQVFGTSSKIGQN
jgi:hypothetical protein